MAAAHIATFTSAARVRCLTLIRLFIAKPRRGAHKFVDFERHKSKSRPRPPPHPYR
jgi:hypothetical protein